MKSLSVLKDVILSPKRAFEEISENGKDFLITALIIVALPNVVSTVLYADYTHLKGVVRDVAEWIVSVILLYAIGKALKGRANFVGLLSAVGYARFPLIFPPILGYLIVKSIPEDVKALIKATKGQISNEMAIYVMTRLLNPITVTLGIIALALILWSLALCVIAVRESNKFSTWRAFCSVVVALFVATFGLTKVWRKLP